VKPVNTVAETKEDKTGLFSVVNQVIVCDPTRNSAIADKPHDTFRGQSRSPNMVPFHMLHMVSYYCAIVTLSVMRTVFFGNSTSKNVVTLKTGLRVHKGR